MFRNATVNKIASNTIYQMLGKLVTMSITIYITVLITRVYGRSGYGEFNIMQNFPGLFFIIVDFGLNAIATRELTKDISKAEKYLGNILLIRALLFVIFSAISFIILRYFPYSEDLKFGIYLSLFLILTQALITTLNIVFQVKLRYDYSTIGLILGSIFILLFTLLASKLGWGIIWINFSYVLGGFISFFVSYYFVKRLGFKLKLNYDKQLWKYLFLETLPIGLMFIFSQINFRTDAILLSILSLPSNLGLNNTESVAVYGLPYKIFEVVLVFPTFFMNSVYPIFVRHLNESKEKISATFTKTLWSLLGFGLLIGILGYIFAPLAIQLLGGDEFVLSVPVLRILLLGVFIFFLTQPISWLIVTLGKQKYLPIIYLISAIINVALNLIFIPKYSFFASAHITWISEGIILLLLTIFALKSWKERYA